jgi:hypothetical protein
MKNDLFVVDFGTILDKGEWSNLQTFVTRELILHLSKSK